MKKIKDNRTESISFRVTPEERKKLELEASEKHCATSQLIRQKLFHKAAVSTGSGKDLLTAVHNAKKEFKRLADFCLSHPDSAKMGPILASAKASLPFIEAYANPKNHYYYSPDEIRRKYTATVVEKAVIKIAKNGLECIYVSVKVNGEDGVIRVCCPYPIYPEQLVKGQAIVIYGYKKENSIYGDVILLRE